MRKATASDLPMSLVNPNIETRGQRRVTACWVMVIRSNLVISKVSGSVILLFVMRKDQGPTVSSAVHLCSPNSAPAKGQRRPKEEG